MKLSSRGFTLVELMIVIAIIGILAAALFPSLTAYLKRSRDAGRSANMNSIATALGAFYSDKETYPNHSGNCVNSGSTGLSTNYMPKGVPTDPTAARNNGCGGNGSYGYGSGLVANGPAYFLSAIFENEQGGNTGGTVALLTPAYLGGFAPITTSPTFVRGTGSGFILAN